MTSASSAGTPVILSALALVVSLVVGIGAWVMARANLQRQIQVTTREAWMREFRKQVAALLTSDTALKQTSEYTIRLLLAEKGGKKNDAFLEVLDRFLTITGNTPRGRGELTTAAAKILERERASIIEGAAGWRRGRGKVANDG